MKINPLFLTKVKYLFKIKSDNPKSQLLQFIFINNLILTNLNRY